MHKRTRQDWMKWVDKAVSRNSSREAIYPTLGANGLCMTLLPRSEAWPCGPLLVIKNSDSGEGWACESSRNLLLSLVLEMQQWIQQTKVSHRWSILLNWFTQSHIVLQGNEGNFVPVLYTLSLLFRLLPSLSHLFLWYVLLAIKIFFKESLYIYIPSWPYQQITEFFSII